MRGTRREAGRHRRAPIVWGLGLIAAGAALLLRSLGLIPQDVHVWPILLIVLGLAWLAADLAFAPWPGSVALPALLTLAGVFYLLRDTGTIPESVSFWPVVLIALGLAVVAGALPRHGRHETAEVDTIGLSGASSASVRLAHGAGRLRVGPCADPGALLRGSFVGGVERRERRRDDRVEIELRPRWGRPRWRPGGRGFDWTVELNPAIPTALRVEGGASEIVLDLAALRVPELRVEIGASRVEIAAPARGRTEAHVQAGAARITVVVPPGVAARVRTKGIGLSSVNVDRGRFPPADGGYASPGFDEAADRLDLTLEGGVAGFEVR